MLYTFFTSTYATLTLAFIYAITIILLVIAVAFFTVLERKVLAAVQRRRGPNMVGAWGLLQALSDGAKLLLKEPILISGANYYIFLLAPVFLLTLSLSIWIFLPLPGYRFGVDASYSFIVVFLFSALNSYAIILAGIASNSRYSLIGGIRAIAQLISYEIPLSLSLLTLFIIQGSYNLHSFASSKIIFSMVALPSLVIFGISLLAETNRTPFDLPEAEAELVAGYNLEYSSILFSLFFLAEYSNILMAASLMSLLFFSGGWFYFGVIFFCLLTIFLRASLPRYTFSQLINLCWKTLVPAALMMLMFTIMFMYLFNVYAVDLINHDTLDLARNSLNTSVSSSNVKDFVAGSPVVLSGYFFGKGPRIGKSWNQRFDEWEEKSERFDMWFDYWEERSIKAFKASQFVAALRKLHKKITDSRLYFGYNKYVYYSKYGTKIRELYKKYIWQDWWIFVIVLFLLYAIKHQKRYFWNYTNIKENVNTRYRSCNVLDDVEGSWYGQTMPTDHGGFFFNHYEQYFWDRWHYGWSLHGGNVATWSNLGHDFLYFLYLSALLIGIYTMFWRRYGPKILAFFEKEKRDYRQLCEKMRAERIEKHRKTLQVDHAAMTELYIQLKKDISDHKKRTDDKWTIGRAVRANALKHRIQNFNWEQVQTARYARHMVNLDIILKKDLMVDEWGNAMDPLLAIREGEMEEQILFWDNLDMFNESWEGYLTAPAHERFSENRYSWRPPVEPLFTLPEKAIKPGSWDELRIKKQRRAIMRTDLRREQADIIKTFLRLNKVAKDFRYFDLEQVKYYWMGEELYDERATLNRRIVREEESIIELLELDWDLLINGVGLNDEDITFDQGKQIASEEIDHLFAAQKTNYMWTALTHSRYSKIVITPKIYYLMWRIEDAKAGMYGSVEYFKPDYHEDTRYGAVRTNFDRAGITRWEERLRQEAEDAAREAEYIDEAYERYKKEKEERRARYTAAPLVVFTTTISSSATTTVAASGDFSSSFKILLFFLVAFCVVWLLVGLNWVLVNFRPNNRKNSPYECGFEPFGSPVSDFTPNFTAVALIFLIYDVEVLLTFPWAFTSTGHSAAALASFFFFTALMMLGLAYEVLDDSFDVV